MVHYQKECIELGLWIDVQVFYDSDGKIYDLKLYEVMLGNYAFPATDWDSEFWKRFVTNLKIKMEYSDHEIHELIQLNELAKGK